MLPQKILKNQVPIRLVKSATFVTFLVQDINALIHLVMVVFYKLMTILFFLEKYFLGIKFFSGYMVPWSDAFSTPAITTETNV